MKNKEGDRSNGTSSTNVTSDANSEDQDENSLDETHKTAKRKVYYVPKPQQLARGVAGRPMSQTPSLIGASPGHIQCDVNVDDLAYWNDPQGEPDRSYHSPFAVEGDEKFLSFAPDIGGWNNIR